MFPASLTHEAEIETVLVYYFIVIATMHVMELWTINQFMILFWW